VTTSPIIIDSQPIYLQGGGRPASLLLTPLGSGTLLDLLYSQLQTVTQEQPTVITLFNPDNDYEKALRDNLPTVKTIVSADEFGKLVTGYEPSDWLLIVDPRYFPADGFHPEKLTEDHDPATSRWITHLVAMESDAGGTRECTLLDTEGYVRRIQRYYDGLTWLRTTGVACSLISAASARLVDTMSFRSLSHLRGALTFAGIPSRDIPLSSGTVDLADERGMLTLSEWSILESIAPETPHNYQAIGPDVLVGQGCRIHPSARIYGPVIIQNEVIIESGAAVIGPTLVGAHSHIQRNAVVAQSLLAQHSVIPRNTTVRHRVVTHDTPLLEANPRNPDCRIRPPSPQMSTKPTAKRTASTPASGKADRVLYPAIKRFTEAVIALLGLVFLSPLLILTSVLVKLTSRGPILFGHEREGKDGILFRCWKFRTMIRDAHGQQRGLYEQNEVDGPQFKLDHDPRVTRLGRWLRVGNVDELPQLINVLTGEMSLIGPRPSPFRENQICVPWRQARLSVRPGITGLWQICRHEREAGDFHQWIYYDTLYVRHMSLWLDIKILLATLFTLGGRWSVPLSWLISDYKLHDEITMPIVSTSMPLLHYPEPQKPQPSRSMSRSA